MKTIVVNLLGGSGLGKSTNAALIFGRLKQEGVDAELVREFVKEWAHQKKPVGPFGQSIIYGHQLEREAMLYNIVEVIVTDSPLVLGPVYQSYYAGHDTAKHAVLQDLKIAKELGVTHLNFLLTRKKKFNPKGRYETEEQAKDIDLKVESFMTSNNIPYITVDCNEEDRVEFITNYVISESKKLN